MAFTIHRNLAEAMPRPTPFWRGILQVPSYALPLCLRWIMNDMQWFSVMPVILWCPLLYLPMWCRITSSDRGAHDYHSVMYPTTESLYDAQWLYHSLGHLAHDLLVRGALTRHRRFLVVASLAELGPSALVIQPDIWTRAFGPRNSARYFGLMTSLLCRRTTYIHIYIYIYIYIYICIILWCPMTVSPRNIPGLYHLVMHMSASPWDVPSLHLQVISHHCIS